MFKSLGNYLLEWRCVVCGEVATQQVCCGCLQQIEFVSENLVENEHAYFFKRIYPLGIFDGVLKKMIHLYKFEGFKTVGDLLVKMLQERFGEMLSRYDLCCFTPLHGNKFKKRGFDQTEFIVEKLFPEERIFRGVRRIRHTKQQSLQHSRMARRSNLMGAFEIDPGEINRIKGQKILLFDDVLTTGATLNSVALPLILGGVAEVDVMVLGLS